MKILRAKVALILTIGICGGCSLSTIWFAACSFYVGDIKSGIYFIIISMILILVGIIAGLSIYCTHWIKYGNKSVVIRRVSKKRVNGRSIGKWENREDKFLLEELVAYGLSVDILPHSVEYHRSSDGRFESECFFQLKDGKMIGYEVGYYLKKDIEDFYCYIAAETGLKFLINEKRITGKRKYLFRQE